jgi:hypothetical protein
VFPGDHMGVLRDDSGVPGENSGALLTSPRRSRREQQCSRDITAVFLERTAVLNFMTRVFPGDHRGVLRDDRGAEFDHFGHL